MPASRSVPLQAYTMCPQREQDLVIGSILKQSTKLGEKGRCWKNKQKTDKLVNTWMKKSLGFPTSDLQRSPRNSDVRYLSSIEPSVPKNTPSSPWLNRTQTNEAKQLWSSFDTGGLKKTKHSINWYNRHLVKTVIVLICICNLYSFCFILTSSKNIFQLIDCLVIENFHFVTQLAKHFHHVGSIYVCTIALIHALQKNTTTKKLYSVYTLEN